MAPPLSVSRIRYCFQLRDSLCRCRIAPPVSYAAGAAAARPTASRSPGLSLPHLFSFVGSRQKKTAPPPPMLRRSRSCRSRSVVEASGLLCLPHAVSRRYLQPLSLCPASSSNAVVVAACARQIGCRCPDRHRCLTPSLSLSLRRHPRNTAADISTQQQDRAATAAVFLFQKHRTAILRSVEKHRCSRTSPSWFS